MSYLVGVDLGSSGAKAGIFQPDGKLVGLKQQEYRFSHPQSLWSEIDPEIVWEAACSCVHQARERAGIDPRDIVGLGLSVIGETVMPLDEDGNPIYPAIESMDMRDNGYRTAVQTWQELVGAEEIFRITSYPLNSLPSANKLMWWRDNKPEIWERAAHFASFEDFVVHRLTGRYVIDYSMASRTMLFDVTTKEWSPRLLELLGLSKSRLSEPCPAYTVVGEMTEQGAKAMRLRAGIPVVAGAHDQACACLGVGVLDEGTAMDGTGSVEAVVVPARQPITDPAMLKFGQGSQCHVRGDVYLAIGFHLAAGSFVRWFRDELAEEEKGRARVEGRDVYELITEKAAETPPGANGLLILPHLSGGGTGVQPPLNALSRGTIVGLTLAHTRADLARAVFEGVTLETRSILDSLEQSGIQIQELRVTGGGAKSPFWLQLKADILRKRIVVPTVTEASLLGAALLAGVGQGTYASLEDAVACTVILGREYQPTARAADTYDRLFRVYQKLYPSLLGFFCDLNNFVVSEKEKGR